MDAQRIHRCWHDGTQITLFHALPGDSEPAVAATLTAAAAAHAPFPVEVPELMPLGRGVAYRFPFGCPADPRSAA